MFQRTLMRGALAALVLAAAWMGVGATSTSAHDAHPGLNFWIAVDGMPGCNTRAGDRVCDVTPGSTFVVDTYLDPLPSDIPNYGAFDVSLRHLGVPPNHDASTAAWPDCVFPAAAYDLLPDTDVVRFACVVGVPPAGPSTYSGLIGTISFTCTQAGIITLLHGRNNTDLIEFEHFDRDHIHAEDPHATEALTITCGTALVRSGDANCDGHVDSVDALLILQWDAHLLSALLCPEAADANADGVVNAVDASLVLQASAGLLQMPPPPTTATITPTPTVTPTPTRCLIVGPGGTSTCCPGPCLVTPTAPRTPTPPIPHGTP